MGLCSICVKKSNCPVYQAEHKGGFMGMYEQITVDCKDVVIACSEFLPFLAKTLVGTARSLLVLCLLFALVLFDFLPLVSVLLCVPVGFLYTTSNALEQANKRHEWQKRREQK